MKRYLTVLCALILGGFATLGTVGCAQSPAHAVNDVASDPAAYAGTITISGIMGGTSRMDPAVFGIMDVKELQCTTPGCNKLFIPVRAAGPIPALGDEVRVTGAFKNEGSGYIFVAEKVKVVKNHKIGG